jgi:hypothetical protein
MNQAWSNVDIAGEMASVSVGVGWGFMDAVWGTVWPEYPVLEFANSIMKESGMVRNAFMGAAAPFKGVT